MLVLLIALGVVLWLTGFVLALALCRVAAQADESMRQHLDF